MLTTIKGIYSNGQIILSEKPPTENASEVLVTFTENIPATTSPLKPRKAGFAKGTFTFISPDFDDPIDSHFKVFD